MRFLTTMALTGMVAAASTALADVPFLTGGIGKHEREEIEAQRDAYNLQVKAALKSGHYLGDVRVMIEDKNQNLILNEPMDGPLFFAKLPPGTYKVYGNYKMQTLEKAIRIRKNTPLREVMFRFDGYEEIIDDDEDEEKRESLRRTMPKQRLYRQQPLAADE